MEGLVAKWKGSGLQNRYSPVRVRPRPLFISIAANPVIPIKRSKIPLKKSAETMRETSGEDTRRPAQRDTFFIIETS